MRVIKNLMIGWLLLSTLGCANLYDVRYEQTQRSRTRSAWRNLPDCAKEHNYPHDYRKGWQDGFYDATTGGQGCPPVVAPSCYWTPGQILENCDNRRHAYYSGWQDGAAHASRFPDTHHIKVWSSCECPLPACQPCAEGNSCMIGSCGTSCGTPQMIPTAITSEMIEGEHIVSPPVSVPAEPVAVPAPAVVPPPAPAPVDGARKELDLLHPITAKGATESLKKFDRFDEGLIDGGRVVNVSSVQEGATVEVAANVTSQSFDPSTAFAKATAKEAHKSASADLKASETKIKTAIEPKATVVEASPITLEPTPAEGTVQMATDIDLSAK